MPLRDHFPIFERRAFINSCSKGALSREVEAAYHTYLSDWETLGSPWELWVEKLEATRQAFATLIHAQPDEVAISSSVSTLVSALASALDFGARPRVVVSDFEFPTIGQVWHAQERRGAQVVHVPERDGVLPLEHFEELIDDRTALVAVTHVSYRHGAKQDIAAIVEIARRHGALVMLDAYQSLGTLGLDVTALGVDLLVGGALKYLLGSSGLAFLYARQDLADLTPTSTGWFAQEDIFAMDGRHHRPAREARRFETGTPPVPNLYAALAGLELIASLGTDAIEAHLRQLTGALKHALGDRSFKLATPTDPELHGAMIAVKALAAEELVDRLAMDGIVVSSRAGNLRVSPHFYNNLGDIDRLIDGLDRHQQLLVR